MIRTFHALHSKTEGPVRLPAHPTVRDQDNPTQRRMLAPYRLLLKQSLILFARGINPAVHQAGCLSLHIVKTQRSPELLRRFFAMTHFAIAALDELSLKPRRS